MNSTIELEKRYAASNYYPLPVVLVKGEGVYLWDEMGREYLDMMGAYSAVSHGHCNPKLLEVLVKQSQQLNVTSRAFHTNKLAPFLQYACEITGQEKALPMNSGAEAVETAIKAVRKWGYTHKGVPDNHAEIIVCENNFHGRTTTIVSFSTEKQYYQGFGPLTPGFKVVPYGEAQALRNAVTPHTVAFLVEPIQGEAGIIVPPVGYLKECADVCAQNNVLFISDEIQTGLGRTGKLLGCDHEGIKPDGIILGKALGGGILPVSLFLSKAEVMDVFTPGDHGSTFGGNPLACAIGLASLQIVIGDNYAARSAELGAYFMEALKKIRSSLIKEVRGKGLFIGVEIATDRISAREVCLRLMENGLLTKDTHQTVLRFCPPLIITQEQVDTAIKIIKHTLKEVENLLH